MKRKQDMKTKRNALAILLALCMALTMLPATAQAASSTEKKTIMVIVPHQDDEANMANAIMYSHAQQGDDVYVVMAFGGDSTDTITDVNGLKRLKESAENMRILGIPSDHLIYLGYQKIDYSAIMNGDDTLKLNEKNELLRKDGETLYLTYSHPEFPSWHSKQHGAECTVSEANLKADLVEIIKEYRPDELYVINYDAHCEHMYLAGVADIAFGEVKQTSGFENYCPRYYQSMSYQSAWLAAQDLLTAKSPNDSQTPFLESTLAFTPRNPTLSWEDRVRFPVADEMSAPSLETNLSAKAYLAGFGTRVYQANSNIKYLLGCINGDQVFWERDTRSAAYRAAVTVSSNEGDAGRLNDFATLYMPMTKFRKWTANAPEVKPDGSDYKWSPAAGDSGKWAQLTFDKPQTLDCVKLCDDYRVGHQITGGLLTFSDGSEVSVGLLNDNGSATGISFEPKENITWVKFQISSFKGEPGLAEFEAYGPAAPRKTDFIQIYLKQVNGKIWKNESFLYDYPVDVTASTQTMQLGVYRYPAESDSTGYTWSVREGDPGITLTQDGLLTVTDEAESGVYTIQAISRDDPDLTDVMTIRVRGSAAVSGDVNMDGLCDYRDLAYVLMGLDGYYPERSDLNDDGVTDATDVKLVWRSMRSPKRE